jgi:hypothetical protein
MVKIIMEFDSSDEAQEAIDGSKWKQAFWELNNELRNTTKYDVSIINNNLQATDIEQEICSKVRDMMFEILNRWNLKID